MITGRSRQRASARMLRTRSKPSMRGDVRWRDLPVIMITSRIAQKHRDHATELGVDHYLGKPYSEEDLLALISRYIVAAQAEA